jgi:hypothetical protein
MDHDDYRIELFIFPDGTAVEMIVFDREGAEAPALPPAGEERARMERACDHAQPRATRPSRAAGRGGEASGDEAAAQAPPEAAGVACDGDAHVCPLCAGQLVYPVDWRRNDEAGWNLRLRCPECETERRVTMDRLGVEALNRRLYHGAQAVAREAEAMTRRNFEEEAARIVDALAAGLILPMDF